jgi:multidrug resistance efflux pump
MKRQIFRQVALERLSSPEQLDQLIQVTTPRGWLALLALIGLIVTVVGWSFSDTIPTQLIGRGILIRGGQVPQVLAPVAGLVDQLLVQVGDEVRQGQVIARVRPGDNPAGPPTDVVSLYAGRVVELAATRGSVLPAGGAVASLEALDKPLEAVIYMPAASGKNVRPGLDVQVSPANLSREEYGFMRGKVRSVATFPASFGAMMLVLGNEQLVHEFLADGTPIEVRIDLEPDATTPSGYRWSSSAGPSAAVNSGTLCDATITLSEQHPIELVFPTH